jgi:hypothetical protein
MSLDLKLNLVCLPLIQASHRPSVSILFNGKPLTKSSVNKFHLGLNDLGTNNKLHFISYLDKLFHPS